MVVRARVAKNGPVQKVEPVSRSLPWLDEEFSNRNKVVGNDKMEMDFW